MMQECYCAKEICSTWEREWGGNCLFAFGSKHSRGTMILFKVGFDVKILSSKEDLQGRYIIAKLEIQGEIFVIVNIYAPNKITEKDLFFQNISSEFEKYDITLSDKLILGGDWNSILDINLDKKGGNKNIINTKPKEII